MIKNLHRRAYSREQLWYPLLRGLLSCDLRDEKWIKCRKWFKWQHRIVRTGRTKGLDKFVPLFRKVRQRFLTTLYTFGKYFWFIL
jgi:hypothetical protein